MVIGSSLIPYRGTWSSSTSDIVGNSPRVARVLVDCSLILYISADGAITQGAGNAYAIVASPAS